MCAICEKIHHAVVEQHQTVTIPFLKELMARPDLQHAPDSDPPESSESASGVSLRSSQTVALALARVSIAHLYGEFEWDPSRTVQAVAYLMRPILAAHVTLPRATPSREH